MATSKTSGSGYAIRFNVSSTRDSSDDDVDNEENGAKESLNLFTDPLNASQLGRDKLSDQSKKVKKKKVDVVRLEAEQKETFNSDAKQTSSEAPKEKSLKNNNSLKKPLSALRKKHSSLIGQPQSAPSSELSSPTTLSKRHHLPSSSLISSNSSIKDVSNIDVERDSKVSMTSASDVSLNSNVNNCNNKDDVFSIFSGLKDKLGRFSAESREILDRKVFKTTSVDVPRIASVLSGNPVEGELLAEEAKEDTQFEVCFSSQGSDDKASLDCAKQSSIDSSTSQEPLETEMKEMSRGASEGELQSNSFDIGRLMKLVHSDSSKKLSFRNSCDDERRSEEYENLKTDESFSSLDVSMTPSDILTHEAAVDAFRTSAGSLLDPGTKRLSDTASGHPKLVKKSSVTGASTQKNVNPFTSEKKETISKSSSISMTLSSLLSRQRSSSKLTSGISPEIIVMTSKTAEIKSEPEVESSDPNVESLSGVDEKETSSRSEGTQMNEVSDDYVVLQNASWPLGEYFRIIKKRVSSTLFSVLAILLSWLFVPLPPYVAGMFTGVIGTLVAVQSVKVFHKLFSTDKRSTKEGRSVGSDDCFTSADGNCGLNIKESKNIDGSFKGWLNELGSGSSNAGKVVYDPKDYHINATHTVYVTLEGTNVRLQTPRLSMPKRALWNDESPASITFVRQRHYDLLGSKVLLLPDNLVSKRLWSKKYPIYIEIMKSHSTHGTTSRSRTAKTSSIKGSDAQVEGMPVDAPKTSQTADRLSSSQWNRSELEKKVLYLFARTSREKEEWFRRFRAASVGHPWPARFSDVAKNSNADRAFQRKTHRRTASQPNKKFVTDGDNLSSQSNVHDAPGIESDALDPSNQISSGMTDYSSLKPELNLMYYAQYMSRSMIARRTSTSEPDELSKSSETGGSTIAEKEQLNKRSSSVGGNQGSDKKGKEQPKNDGNSKNGKKEDDLDSDEGHASPEECDTQLIWLNTLVSRCFMDFLREKYWVEKIREKIQKKLSKIHIPYIMDQLSVTGIDLGSSVPTICSASQPYLDDRGYWVDLKVSYAGGFCITMETKCNLMKLKQNASGKSNDGSLESSDSSSQFNVESADKKLAALHSDEEDSAESSTDEECRMFEDDLDEAGEDKKMNQPIGKRLLRLVDKISQSRYFQQATDYKYIRRAIEEVSNTRLELNVEVKSLSGVLAINVPPPPTDRIWYGFRGNPQFHLAARPRVGVREVSLSPVTEWIEKKLAIEFQRVFVMPNMDDVKIPLMLDHLA